ncbi:hypothetical protein [Cupriavidus pinatubonensis]|uniref:hypothetical protein n=1 Tax=Cupriavidus pinatubonensis TaxID=248026 RepID=UPI00361CED5E
MEYNQPSFAHVTRVTAPESSHLRQRTLGAIRGNSAAIANIGDVACNLETSRFEEHFD